MQTAWIHQLVCVCESSNAQRDALNNASNWTPFFHLMCSLRLKERFQIVSSRKHAYIILTPFNPTFFIVKLGLTWVSIIFLISAQNMDCGYALEPPRRGGSCDYPQSMF